MLVGMLLCIQDAERAFRRCFVLRVMRKTNKQAPHAIMTRHPGVNQVQNSAQQLVGQNTDRHLNVKRASGEAVAVGITPVIICHSDQSRYVCACDWSLSPTSSILRTQALVCAGCCSTASIFRVL